MKLLVLLVIGCPAFAQLPPSVVPLSPRKEQGLIVLPTPPAKDRAVTISATTVRVGAITNYEWRTSWGSYSKDYERMQHVLVNCLRWANVGEFEVEAIWFGRQLSGRRSRVVLNRETKRVTPGESNILMKSGVVEGNVTFYATRGELIESGHKVEGWYVRVIKDGKTLHDATSLYYLADIARDPVKLAAVPVGGVLGRSAADAAVGNVNPGRSNDPDSVPLER